MPLNKCIRAKYCILGEVHYEFGCLEILTNDFDQALHRTASVFRFEAS